MTNDRKPESKVSISINLILVAMLFVFGGIILGLVLHIHGMSERSKKEQEARQAALQTNQQRDSTEQTQATVGTIQGASTETDETTPESQTVSYWNHYSDGYAWNRATAEQKMELCNRLATVSSMGLSAQYFYDALDTAYDTHDPNILVTPLTFTTEYIEKGTEELEKEGKLDE